VTSVELSKSNGKSRRCKVALTGRTHGTCLCSAFLAGSVIYYIPAIFTDRLARRGVFGATPLAGLLRITLKRLWGKVGLLQLPRGCPLPDRRARYLPS
jgi:hypothetical protein